MTVRSALTIIRATADRLDVPLPAAVTDEITRGDTLVALAVEAVTGVHLDALTDAALDAIEKAGNPATDKTVQRVLIETTLAERGLTIAARTRADRRLAEAIATIADDILTAWAAALQPHAEHLAAAAEANLPDSLTDTAGLHDAESMYLAADANIANQRWSDAVSGFAQLANLTDPGIGYGDPVLVMTTADYDTVQRVRHNTSHPDAWALARLLDTPLRLATIADYRQRQTDYAAQAQAAADTHRHAVRATTATAVRLR